MQVEWVRSIRDQCSDAGVAFFFKQWGGVRKSESGRELDGTTYDAMPVRSPNPIGPPQKRAEMIRELESQVAAVV